MGGIGLYFVIRITLIKVKTTFQPLSLQQENHNVFADPKHATDAIKW